MSIKGWEEYSKKYDMIEGLVDMGFLGRRNERSKQVLLLCLDSINAKNPWRQLFAYFFTGSGATGSEILDIIQKGLTLAKSINALVKLCDQGAANQKAYKLLNVCVEQPYFKHNEEKCLASFDWPHLVKRLIYHLRTYKNIYCDNKIIVSFDDLYNTWQIDKSNHTSNLLGHMSLIYFEPSSSFDAMNVKRAFQLLSHRMASAIKTVGANELKSSTWQVSAEFVEQMNAVIDACNARILICRNPLKRPLSENNPQIRRTLQYFKHYVKNWKVKKGNSFVQPPCFLGMSLTVSALLDLYDDITKNCKNFELATALCNQDSVEHANSKFRGRGGFNNNPTARLYRLTFRHIISIDSEFIYTSNKGNVVIEETHSLLKVTRSSVGFSQVTEDERKSILEEIDKKVGDIIDDQELQDAYNFAFIKKDDKFFAFENKGSYEKNAIAYFAGYIVRHCLIKFPCENCRNIFAKTPMEEIQEDEKYLEHREYHHEDDDAPTLINLTRATDIFKKVVSLQLEAFAAGYKQYWYEQHLLQKLVTWSISYTNKLFPGWFDNSHDCNEHKIQALK